MTRVSPVLRALGDEQLIAIGIPRAALRVCRLSDPALGESIVARFDFAWTDDGPKVLELNAETPFFLWESHEIAGATARAFGFDDPNATSQAALRAAIARAAGGRDGSRVAVTAYNTWREDWFSAVFAAHVASEAIGRNVDVVPLHELRVSRGALRDAAGGAIDVLWRFYPLEHFASDVAGPALFDLLEAGALRLINPPSALLLQNKAALAVVWELAERGVWFDRRERATIARLFLPTFLDAPRDAEPYVRKPVLGREGNSVAIVRGAATLAASAACDYGSQPAVYQRFVALPDIHGGKAIATCFVTDGVPGAVALRVGGVITDGRARFVPLGMKTRSRVQRRLRPFERERRPSNASPGDTMDLTSSFPRSVKDKVAGVVMLGRTIDKGKAVAHGNVGEYHYNCPMDQAVFGFLGIDQAQLLDKIGQADGDGEIESYVKPFVAKKSSQEIEQWNAGFLQSSPPPGSDGEKYFLELRGSVAPDRTDVTTWADLLDLDEKRDVPERAAAV